MLQNKVQLQRLPSSLKAYIEGKKDDGLRITTEWEQKDLWDAEMIYRLACNYSLLGDKNSCFRVLLKSVETGFFNYLFMLNDTFLDPVRDDPEFKELDEVSKISSSLDMIDERIDGLLKQLESGETKIFIGKENPIRHPPINPLIHIAGLYNANLNLLFTIAV